MSGPGTTGRREEAQRTLLSFGCHVGITFKSIGVGHCGGKHRYLAEHSLEARRGDGNKRVQKKLHMLGSPPAPVPPPPFTGHCGS